jgi:integrase
LRELKEQEAKNKVISIKGIVLQRDGRPLYPMLIGRTLNRACRLSGIENFRFHDLRHTFQKGTSLYVVQKLLGHKDGRMTQRDAHLSHEQFADAVDLLNGLGHKSQKSVRVGEKEKELQVATP